jgi:hypothetical protein
MEKKITNYGIRNPGAGLGQAQQSGRVKPVNGIPNLPFLACMHYFMIWLLSYINTSWISKTDLLFCLKDSANIGPTTTEKKKLLLNFSPLW